MVFKQLNNLTALELIELLKKDKISVEEIAISFIENIKKNERRVKAWEYFDKNQVLINAQKLDKIKRSKKTLNSLSGIPIGIKDIFNTYDMPTSMGSQIWNGFTPGNDARVVHNIREKDGLIFGKTVTAEFAVHFLPANKTVNPHNSSHIPGTSSSGSAAAVASKMVPLALGSQTAGSIIRPASYCGVFGFKPSFGAVPRTGSLKTTDTLDTIGCFSNSIGDIKLLFDVIRVKGSNYPYVNKFLEKYSDDNNEKIKVGFLLEDDWLFDNYKTYAKRDFLLFIDRLKIENEIEVSKVEIDSSLKEIHDLHNTLYNKTLSYYFKNEFKNMNKISFEIKELIEIGNNINTATYIDALNQQEIIRNNIEQALSSFDLVLTLSTGGVAPIINEDEIPDTCLIWTFLGLPVLNLPIFKGPKELPYGLQVIGTRFSDYKILKLSKKLLEKSENSNIY